MIPEPRPVISLVIPTRERAHYLDAAIRSALVAADAADAPVEIVVSDNASSDDTPAVIAGFDDPRIVALRTDRRLSMRENFQFALSHTTGDHVLFIGDDDAVLPNGLRLLADLIARHDPDIVKWRVMTYLWPDPRTGAAGTLRVRPQALDGRLKRLDPAAVLDGFARARFRSYHDGGMIYHGCISRRLIARAEAASGGPYFRGSSPDVFTSLQALMVTDRPILRINLPITLGGSSPRSNGAAGQKLAVSGASAEGTEFARFIAETGTDPYQCRLPVSCPSLTMMTLDCLQCAAELQGYPLKIDAAAWSARIAADIGRFAEPTRSTCEALARVLLGPDFHLDDPASESAVPVAPSPAPAPAPPDGPALRRVSTTLHFEGGRMTADAAAAADTLDGLVRLGRTDARPPGALGRVRNVLGQHARARWMLR
ncbi:glycosyltransferase family 2 protein [Rhodovulum visakhapatnamense]|uniref:Glycosyltransferase involved in cell wall biosynthesis n=1 Tax=Rhodovulum visakhapatnamense TaxID=364297 RepID=A0A4R8FWT9_9RHOB|nr:glycosyltransferase family 2 protein [Rhodovulum visakhapatnamense]TDX31377.1 glycosyltransferase involved in cell wall biosynthesis [Rhodovulum visakhapatnamense]